METCSICLSDDTDLYKTDCCHYFHKQCLKPWVDAHYSCPYCRAKINSFSSSFSSSSFSSIVKKLCIISMFLGLLIITIIGTPICIVCTLGSLVRGKNPHKYTNSMYEILKMNYEILKIIFFTPIY